MKNLHLSLLMATSLLICSLTNAQSKTITNTSKNSNEIQRVRLDFTTPTGFVRHLLLGFTPDNAASDDFDFGYDAANIEDWPDDLNWIIENERYVIQGVGSFHDTKYYPLGMFLSNEGEIKISLDTLENFESQVNVYIFDVTTGIYTNINDQDFVTTLSNSTYLHRFYITFNETSLSDSLTNNDFNLVSESVFYNSYKKEISINSKNQFEIINVELVNILGQNVLSSKQETISVESLKSNYYIMILETNLGTIIKKIIVY